MQRRDLAPTGTLQLDPLLQHQLASCEVLRLFAGTQPERSSFGNARSQPGWLPTPQSTSASYLKVKRSAYQGRDGEEKKGCDENLD